MFLTKAAILACTLFSSAYFSVSLIWENHWRKRKQDFLENFHFVTSMLSSVKIVHKFEKMELTKANKEAIIVKKKIASARVIVYNEDFIRAGPVFLVRVPILSMLGLPLQTAFWARR